MKEGKDFLGGKNIVIFRIASGTYWYTDPLAAVKHVLRLLLLPMLAMLEIAMHKIERRSSSRTELSQADDDTATEFKDLPPSLFSLAVEFVLVFSGGMAKSSARTILFSFLNCRSLYLYVDSRDI